MFQLCGFLFCDFIDLAERVASPVGKSFILTPILLAPIRPAIYDLVADDHEKMPLRNQGFEA
jgi:hypothetical protein